MQNCYKNFLKKLPISKCSSGKVHAKLSCQKFLFSKENFKTTKNCKNLSTSAIFLKKTNFYNKNFNQLITKLTLGSSCSIPNERDDKIKQ